ncbi:polymer-forming cytoskeletal protein [Pleionea sp. CnH1-48]|uniref:bactofilin family protein n=1 Tax=Pleionea sp. CnH1-48 TaxID=2954494 RepID=UPI0020974471|nr:polymer-forming cytoskeletal protein [Pleionea sp. CnH1-48]MCO7226354.1 polymer-forming cytoskeletal protein [Pleionea sp. CnH1-48]
MNDMTLGSKPSSDSKPFLSGMKEEAKPAEATSKVEQKLAKDHSVIGKNIKFRGELIGTEDLHIEGTVEGTVIMEGQNLSIGEEGEINANIHAQNLVINGKLTGDVLADELIEIRKSAVVKGNLIAPRIQLDDGGKFRGSMDMIDTDDEKKQRHIDFKQKLIHPHLPANDAVASDNKVSSTPAQPATQAAKESSKPNNDSRNKNDKK